MPPDPASCKKLLLIHMFAAQDTRFPGRNRVWLKFTASEDKPHAPTVGFSSSFPVIPAKAGIHYGRRIPKLEGWNRGVARRIIGRGLPSGSYRTVNGERSTLDGLDGHPAPEPDS